MIKNIFDDSNIVIISSHPDDIENTMGGTLSLLLRKHKFESLHIFVMSPCEESIPVGMEPGTIVKECYKSLVNVYNIDRDYIKIYNFPVRRFDEHRQDILEALIQIKEEYRPDIVFSPSRNDLHQDHTTLGNEVCRAFNNITILQYESFKNNSLSDNILYIKFKENDIKRKFMALQQYLSQHKRAYLSYNIISSIAYARGSQCGSDKPAEAFEVIKMVIC